MFVIQENGKPMPIWAKSLWYGFGVYLLQIPLAFILGIIIGFAELSYHPDDLSLLPFLICWLLCYAAIRWNKKLKGDLP